MAKANPFRFSIKYQADKADLVYYGYRYYNASAGRWLSRDPSADTRELGNRGTMLLASRPAAQGGQSMLNLYAFVINRPTVNSDFLGLDVNSPPTSVSGNYNCGCKCGLNVDNYISQTLQNITAAFNAADELTQMASCNDLFIPDSPGYVIDAWDIKTMQNGVPPVVQRPPCDSCASRVTFQGGCYTQGDVNYIMFGHVASLCKKKFNVHWNATIITAMVTAVKSSRGFPVGCSVAFALSGFDGRPISCGDANWSKVCPPNNQAFTGGDPGNWVWEPLRPRLGTKK